MNFDTIMADTQSNDQDKQVKKLKRKLEGWREAILPLHSVLMWEKKWYPAVIFSSISAIFILFWLFDPPIFTILASTGIIITLMDYFVPVLISHFYTPDSWNKNKEKLFEEICKSMVLYYNWFYYTTESFYRMREASPRMYYAILITSLSSFAWIGSSTSNLLLTYMTTLYICFLPGLLNNNRVGAHLIQLANTISNVLQPQQKIE